MKHIASFPLISVVLSVLLHSGCTRSVDSAKAGFHPALTQAEVRVVLLRASPVASSANQPGFKVTYGVEVPTNGAFSALRFDFEDVPVGYRNAGDGA